MLNQILRIQASTYFKVGLIGSCLLISMGVFAFVNFEAAIRYLFMPQAIDSNISYFMFGFGTIGLIFNSIMLYRCMTDN